MCDTPCLIICPADDDRPTKWCLFSRRVFPSYEKAEIFLKKEQENFPGGRSIGAEIVECYFGTNLREAKPSDWKEECPANTNQLPSTILKHSSMLEKTVSPSPTKTIGNSIDSR